MEFSTDALGAAAGAVADSMGRLAATTPAIIHAPLILAVGAVAGWVVMKAVTKALSAINADSFADRMGYSGIMRKGGVKQNFSPLAGKVAGGAVVLIFAAVSVETLDATAFGNMGRNVFMYLMNMFVAGVVLMAGYMIANFLGRAALISAVNSGMKGAGAVGAVVKYFVIFLSISIAAEHLGIGKDTIVLAFGIVFGGSVFALSLAFGLGGQGVAKDYLESLFKRGDPKEGDKDDSGIKHL